MANVPDTKLKGVPEICNYLRVGKRTFYALLDFGLPVCMFGNAYRADTTQIDQWYANFVKKGDINGGETRLRGATQDV
jgi:excisionase family DNA binding protein